MTANIDNLLSFSLEEVSQFLIFLLEGKEYAVNILEVVEVIRLVPIVYVPSAPDYMNGIINIRGQAIPVIDLKYKLGLETTEENENNRIIIVKLRNYQVGMLVEGISEILDIPHQLLQSVPLMAGAAEAKYLKHIARLENRFIIVLSLDKILSGIETEELESLQLPLI